MKLYIDTSQKDKIIIGIDDKLYETPSKHASSQRLLPFIDEILTKNSKTTQDITNIEVNIGPGSFTGLRVGVAVANALAWSLKVPVNGKKDGIETQIKY